MTLRDLIKKRAGKARYLARKKASDELYDFSIKEIAPSQERVLLEYRNKNLQWVYVGMFDSYNEILEKLR